jgi:predicted acyltransferase
MNNAADAARLRSAPLPSQRLVSLDAYRGFTMLAMASAGFGTAHLMHHPTWGWLADQLEHRAWIGCTAWDLIQPAFMFIVGVAMPLAFARRRERGESWGRQFGHALQRALVLIALGIFLDSYGQARIYIQFIRVLQQIAIGYVLAFFVLYLGPWVQALAAGVILLVHAAAYAAYGSAVGCWAYTPGHNLGTHVDVLLHLPVSTGNYATLNALSSTATILFGVLAGELLRSRLRADTKALVLALAGAGGLLLGLALSPTVPLIKRLWTSSFALYAGGWTCLMLLGFYLVIDVLKFQRWAFPLVVIGMNSIAMYMVSQLCKPLIRGGLRPFVAEPLSQAPLAEPVIMAVLVVVVEWGFCYWLYRHRIFFKV